MRVCAYVCVHMCASARVPVPQAHALHRRPESREERKATDRDREIGAGRVSTRVVQKRVRVGLLCEKKVSAQQDVTRGFETQPQSQATVAPLPLSRQSGHGQHTRVHALCA